MVTVDIEGSRPVEVQIREDAPVITVIFRAADKAGVQLQLYHTLFEVHELLKIGLELEYYKGWMYGWMDDWMVRWMVGWMDGWADVWMDRWLVGSMDGQMDEWMVGWMNGWID